MPKPILPPGVPPCSENPLLARLLAPPGPARPLTRSQAGAAVVVVPGRYSVTYLLVGEGGVVVVDVGSIKDVAAVQAALAWLGRTAADVRGVLPTHLHVDHCMGIDRLARVLGAPVLLHEVAHQAATGRRRLRFPTRLRLLRAIPTYFLQGAPRPPRGEVPGGFEFGFPWSRNRFGAPLVPLADGDPLPGLEGWRVLHTPGHADDAICLHHREARYLVAGDTVRNFLGGEWNPLLADRQEYRASQHRLRQLAVETVFPGHGPVIEGEQVIHRLAQHAFYVP